MNALSFALKNHACKEGIIWLGLHPDILTLEEAWDSMIKEGNRFVFWLYTRFPGRTRKAIHDFAIHVKTVIGEQEDVEPYLVRSIMKDYDNPYWSS